MIKTKKSIKNWHKKNIVAHWYKTATVWVALAAAVLPELLQIGLENLDLLVKAAVPLMSDTAKSRLQMFLILAIPVVRAWKQKSLAEPTVNNGETK